MANTKIESRWASIEKAVKEQSNTKNEICKTEKQTQEKIIRVRYGSKTMEGDKEGKKQRRGNKVREGKRRSNKQSIMDRDP